MYRARLFSKVRNNSGMALLITIMVISLLIAITIQFNRTVRDNYFTASSQLTAQQLTEIARSGITISAALLEADAQENEYDSFHDVWAELDKDALSSLFTTGELSLSIVDFSGMLQVNSLVVQSGEDSGSEEKVNRNRDILMSLLLSPPFSIESEEEAREIIHSLVDWIDEDDRESDYGAESSYYQSLDKSYKCKNGPITVLDELLLVKGITPDLLYGDSNSPGLKEFLTVYGSDGTININTAPVELLIALDSLMTENLAELLDEYRLEEANSESLEDKKWYQTVTAFPDDITFPEDLITTKSSFFQVRSRGKIHEQQRTITAVVQRDGKKRVELLFKKAE